MEYQSAPRIDGDFNMGGTLKRIWYTTIADLLTQPVAPVQGADQDVAAILTGDFTATEGFKFIDVIDETSELTFDGQGSVDGQSFKNTFIGEIPANKAQNLGLLAKLANTALVFIIPNAEGKNQVVGSIDLPAYLDAAAAKGKTGKKRADLKSLVISISASANYPAPFFTGAFNTAP